MLSLGKLLELTVAGREPAQKTQMTVGGTRLRWLAEGALEVTPPPAHDSGLDLLLSAGVHGNETAPVELLDTLIHAIARGDLRPRVRILFLIGNPAALRRQVRFVEQDINRLFNGRHELSSGLEAIRACELERLAASFFHPPGRQRLHYDLHTSARGSRIEPFALCPWQEGRDPSTSGFAWLRRLGVAAAVLQGRPGVTFSAYSYESLGAEAFSLELGKAQGGVLDLLEHALRGIILGEDDVQAASAAASPAVFSVVREIIKRTDEFRLQLPGGIEDFTELPRGALLAVDSGNTRWLVEEEHARIVFPDDRVAVGLRAGLIVVPA